MSDIPFSKNQLCELLTAFKQAHDEEFHLIRLGYFGSHARNETTAESDVDIVFETDKPNLFRTVRLREELEALLGRPVDIVQLQGLSNAKLRARLEREAIYV